MSAIVKIYGNHVLNGTKKFEDVPVSIADEVREYILGIDPDFFDPTEESVEDEVNEEESTNEANVVGGGGSDGEPDGEGAEESETDETAEEVIE